MTRAEILILENYAHLLKNLKVSVDVKSRAIKFDFEPSPLPRISQEVYKKYYTHPLGYTYVVGDLERVREFLRPLFKLMSFRSENMELEDFILSENYRFEGKKKNIYVEDYIFGVSTERFDHIRIKIENDIITKLSLVDGYKKCYLDSKASQHVVKYHLPEAVRNACLRAGVCLLFWSLRALEWVEDILDPSFKIPYDWLIVREISPAHTIRYG